MPTLGETMAETDSFSAKMQKLQQMRVALVLLLSAESSKLMSKQQRVAGKEIEVMCAERDYAEQAQSADALRKIYAEDRIAKEAVAETEAEITRMEDVLAKIDADIGAMCQS